LISLFACRKTISTGLSYQIIWRTTQAQAIIIAAALLLNPEFGKIGVALHPGHIDTPPNLISLKVGPDLHLDFHHWIIRKQPIYPDPLLNIIIKF
jgi:hypothetical protein